MVSNDNGQGEGDPLFGPAYGDPLNDTNTFGDNMPPINDTTFRHYHCNVNGITQQYDFYDAQNHVNALRFIESASTSIVEHNCNLHQTDIRQNLHDILRSDDRRICNIFSHLKEEAYRFDGYQPGGTLLQVQGGLSSRVTKRISDPYGRWSHAILTAKGGSQVHLVSAYRVCQSSERGTGPNTAYMQQYRTMAESGVRNPKPRTAFFADLETHLNNHVLPKDKLILSVDANEPDEAGNFLSQWKERNGLTNALTHLHGDATPKTYQRGRQAIDHIFVNANCLPALRKGGHIPFNRYHLSDHCALFADFHKPTLFGKSAPDPTDGTTKYPRPYHPTERNKYHKLCMDYLERHKIKDQLLKIIPILDQHEPGKAPPQVHKQIQALERKKTELMKAAARQCHSVKKGGKYPYSPKLSAAAQPVLYWKERLSCHRNGTEMPPEKKFFQTMYGIKDTAGNDRLLIEQNLSQAFTQLRAAQGHSIQLRNEFLKQLAQDRAQRLGTDCSVEIENIRRSEEVKRLAQHHGYIMKGDQQGAMREVLVPIPTTTDSLEWTTVRDEDQMYNVLLSRNLRKFMASAKNPFAAGPLNDLVGHTGEKAAADALLDGTFLDTYRDQLGDILTPEFEAFLQCMKKHPNANDDIDPEITVEDFQSLFRKTKPTTSCGPSGLHMGHWVSAAFYDDLSEIHVLFMNVACRYKIVYDRWAVTFHCMLQKDLQPYIHRLRIITLFEADYNAVQKILLARRLMRHTEKFNMNSEQTFGSRPGRRAQDPILINQFLCDYARIMKVPIVNMFNDADGCYDRIRHNIMAIALRKRGCNKTVIETVMAVLLAMRHHVKCSVGVSKAFFQWTELLRIGGIGQGSGDGPVGWHAIVEILIEALEKLEGHGVDITSPSGIRLLLSILGFVDDNQLVNIFHPRTTPETIFQTIKKRLATWHKLLIATGGDLALHKCNISVGYWTWRDGIAQLRTIAELPGEVEITPSDTREEPQVIKRIEVTEAERVLGIRQSISGQYTTEFQYRLKRSTELAGKLARGSPGRLGAEMIYQQRWRPAITYCCPAANFTEQQCKKIQTPFYQVLLPMMGFNRNTPRAVIFGPKRYGGRGLMHLYTETGIQHVETIIRHVRHGTTCGDSALISAEVYQVFLGTERFFLECNANHYAHRDRTQWVDYLWDFCTKADLTISITKIKPQKKLFPRDAAIMDVFYEDDERVIPVSLAQRINRCRLWLKVTYVSELFDPVTNIIYPWARSGDRLPYNRARYSTFSKKWPDQEKCPRSDWNAWYEFVKRQLLVNGERAPRFRPGEATITPNPTPIHQGLMGELLRLPKQYHHFFQHICIPPDEGWAVAEALMNGSLIAGSDGSVKHKLGTHAYKLQPPAGDSIEGSAQSAGTLAGMASLRAEHHGEISILLVLIALCRFYQITEAPPLRIYIDNMEVVTRHTKTMEHREKLRDYDLWAVSKALRIDLPIEAPNRWVKAHQDEDTPFEDLSPAAHINIAVDKLASDRQRTTQGQPSKQVPHYGPEDISVFLRGEKITHDIRQTIENYYNGKNMRCYLISKMNWTGDIFKLVDWDAFEGAMSGHRTTQLTNITKYIFRWQNCRAQTLQFDTARDLAPINHKKYMCPMCGTELETSDHILQCRNKRAVASAAAARLFLGKALTKQKTPERLINAIKYGLRIYSTSPIRSPTEHLRYPRDFNTHLNVLIDQAFDTQSRIGWDNFARGFISKDWEKCMAYHYSSCHKGDVTLNSDRWAIKLVQQLHEYGLRAWNHRNSIIHGEADCNYITKDELKRQVERCYELRAFLGTEYDGLFTTPKSTRMKQKTQTIQLWIATIDTVHKEKSNRLRRETQIHA